MPIEAGPEGGRRRSGSGMSVEDGSRLMVTGTGGKGESDRYI